MIPEGRVSLPRPAGLAAGGEPERPETHFLNHLLTPEAYINEYSGKVRPALVDPQERLPVNRLCDCLFSYIFSVTVTEKEPFLKRNSMMNENVNYAVQIITYILVAILF